jgi:Right handed beta helix region
VISFILPLRVLLIGVAVSTLCSMAAGQATRTWVSGVGNDADPCSRTAPCKTFAGAISKTAAGGEIDCIDSGGFGAVTITKSMTIDGSAVHASILASGGVNGVIVNAGVNDVVTLRNLSINGAGTGLSGIRFLGGAELMVENCRIMGFVNQGIDVNKAAGAKITIRNCIISRCLASGINLFTSAGTLQASIDSCGINSNLTGIRAGNGSRAFVHRSDLSLNTNGLVVQHSSLESRAEVDSCKFAYLGTALQSGPGALSLIRLTRNTIHNNTTALSGAGGTFATDGNNSLMGNTSDGAAATLILNQ